jgi:hypothetical protein
VAHSYILVYSPGHETLETAPVKHDDIGGDAGAGYHLADIRRGTFGEADKLSEEVAELVDAEAQGSRVMALVELSDLYGAMEGYLARHYPGFTMADLQIFSAITQRAFRNGHRE